MPETQKATYESLPPALRHIAYNPIAPIGDTMQVPIELLKNNEFLYRFQSDETVFARLGEIVVCTESAEAIIDLIMSNDRGSITLDGTLKEESSSLSLFVPDIVDINFK
ncbi:hypothetical protein GOV04_04165 [Candidatus Woesearchaeota archaeon]|nr:hypothetical protein [Candidatus Woesearchaeota archaeon]